MERTRQVFSGKYFRLKAFWRKKVILGVLCFFLAANRWEWRRGPKADYALRRPADLCAEANGLARSRINSRTSFGSQVGEESAIQVSCLRGHFAKLGVAEFGQADHLDAAVGLRGASSR